MNFSRNRALVAGAGGGMGLAVANQLIGQGLDVCLADIKPRPDDIADGPGRSVYLQGDFAEESGAAALVSEAAGELGGIDYLVNTIGVLWFDRDRSVVDMEMAVWQQLMQINLGTMVHLARNVVPLMQQNDFGAMVHFSSIDALSGDPLPQDAYGAAKAAMIRLSKSLAVQFAPQGIRSNVVLPGPTLTPLQARWEGREDLQEKVASHIPLGRLGNVEDLANACLFLLSDEASYITGTELIVDGGLTALP